MRVRTVCVQNEIPSYEMKCLSVSTHWVWLPWRCVCVSVCACSFFTATECCGGNVRNVPGCLYCFPTHTIASNRFSHPSHIYHLKAHWISLTSDSTFESKHFTFVHYFTHLFTPGRHSTSRLFFFRFVVVATDCFPYASRERAELRVCCMRRMKPCWKRNELNPELMKEKGR